jgi:dTDP-4-dehydrorhamnose 3,5-epimerase
MDVQNTPLDGCKLIVPTVFGDPRGFFLETYREDVFQKAGLPTQWVQDNFSRSAKGILRGLHFQRGDAAQGKLVRCTQGTVFDVVVDLRRSSKTFGQWYGVELSETNHHMLFVPEGFAHGFCVLSEMADFQYKCTRVYNPKVEGGLIWNDPTVGIRWPLTDPKLSDKDKVFPQWAELLKTL